ncbi:MAG TPA: hypothetical protein ENK31_04280, partial [Nannocystis exedens]|nr:hypothetical protein [Nannocystis exedens]
LDFGFWAGLVVLFFILGLPFVQYMTRSERFAGGLFSLLLMVALPTIHYQAGYFPAPVLAWFACFPIFVTFFLGVRFGLASALTTAASVLYLANTLPLARTEVFASFFPTFVATFSVSPVLAFFLSMVYERNRSINESSLHQLNLDLGSARADAERADRRKTEYLRHMSHELRTPLNAIIGYSELLVEELDEVRESELGEDAQRITDASQQLLRLINGLLDISRIEAGAIELVFEEIDLASLFEGLRDTLEPLVAANNNRLETVVAAGVKLVCDRQRLHQVLINLVGNAAKFTEQGTITITADTVDCDGEERVQIKVCDTGVGIAPEQLGQVFEAFVQVSESANQRRKGTGLGLAISEKLINALGGSISVTSTLGVGSTFTIDLPMGQP